MKQSLAILVVGVTQLLMSACMGQDIYSSVNVAGTKTVDSIQVIQPHFLWKNYLPAQKKDAQVAHNVKDIFQDSKGNLWFGTSEEGVGRFDGKDLFFITSANGLIGGQISGIAEDNEGHIWFATDNGISKFDGKSISNFTKNEGLTDNKIRSIFKDDNGIIWAGTRNGLCRFDGNRFSPVAMIQNQEDKGEALVSYASITAITQDRSGTLWFGTDGQGIFRFNGSTFTNFSRKDGLVDDRINSLMADRAGNLWVGTVNMGLCRYEASTFSKREGPIKVFNKNEGTGSNNIANIFEDKAGNIWFSAEGFGVYRYDGKTLTHFGTNEGLKIKSVQAIFEDSKGFLWIGGNGGLYRFGGDSFYNVKREMLLDGC